MQMADAGRQSQVFGPVPTAEGAIADFIRRSGHPTPGA